jgi:hypothetical protein
MTAMTITLILACRNLTRNHRRSLLTIGAIAFAWPHSWSLMP